MNDKGESEKLNPGYGEATSHATFETDHLSYYMVGYKNIISFVDWVDLLLLKCYTVLVKEFYFGKFLLNIKFNMKLLKARKLGVNPTRTGHCKRGACSYMPLSHDGKAEQAL